MKMMTGINPKIQRMYKGKPPVITGSTSLCRFIVFVIKGIATLSLRVSKKSEILGKIIGLSKKSVIR